MARGVDWRRVWDSDPGRLGLVGFAFGVALALSDGLLVLADRLAAVGEPGTVSRLLVGVFALQVVGFGGVLLVAVGLQDGPWWAVLRVGELTAWVVFYGAAVGLALMSLASVATGLFVVLDIEPAQSAVGAAEDPRFYLLLFVLSTAVVVPLEEAFFRGFVQARLAERFHTALAIGVASAFFVVVHAGVSVGAGGEALAAGLFFALSAVLGVSYAVTNNLLVPIVGHALFNGTQILVRTLELLV